MKARPFPVARMLAAATAHAGRASLLHVWMARIGSRTERGLAAHHVRPCLAALRWRRGVSLRSRCEASACRPQYSLLARGLAATASARALLPMLPMPDGEDEERVSDREGD